MNQLNNSNPLVSILIPLYNSEKYITETIESCLSQTWKNIEIIIVDDGSSDNSYELAKSYESEKVKIIKQENKGACVARNKAFDLSKGEYIQFLDADDLLSKKKIENQLNIFKKYGNNIIVSSKWDRFYNDISDATFPNRPTYMDYENNIDWIIDVIEKNDMGQTSVWLAHREIIEKAGKWNESLTINQDGEFFTRVLLNSKSIKFCKDAFVFYRSGDKTRISYTTNKRTESLLKSYMSIEKHLLSKEDSERTRYACYKNYLRFIYENYSADYSLTERAKEQIYKLGFKNFEPYGGKRFKKISKIIGFENALRLRKLISLK